MGWPTGNNTERLHCCDTVKVSLLCNLIAINIDYSWNGNDRDHVVHGTKLLNQRTLSLISAYFRYFMATFPLAHGMCDWVEDGALVLTLPGQNRTHGVHTWTAFCQLDVSTWFLWISCNLFIQLYFLAFFISSQHTKRISTFWGFLQ